MGLFIRARVTPVQITDGRLRLKEVLTAGRPQEVPTPDQGGLEPASPVEHDPSPSPDATQETEVEVGSGLLVTEATFDDLKKAVPDLEAVRKTRKPKEKPKHPRKAAKLAKKK